MTKLRAKLIEIFQKLSEIEMIKGRFYPSKAFKSVANALEICDHYSINDGIVKITNHSTGFVKMLGSSSSEVFIEYVNQNTCSRIDSDPVINSDLDKISGIGEVKRSKLIKSGIYSSKDLIKFDLKIGEVIPGTNITYTQQIDSGLKLWNKTHGVRITRDEASKYISSFKSAVTDKIYVLGSYRRNKSTIGDIDIVVVNDGIDYSTKIINWLDSVLVSGSTKIAGIKGNTQVDVRIIDEKFLGAHILHATGSQEFNIKLRAHAKSLGMRLNEYGIYDQQGIFHTFKTEQEIFDFLGVRYIPPEMR